jgi:hypothetical protein
MLPVLVIELILWSLVQSPSIGVVPRVVLSGLANRHVDEIKVGNVCDIAMRGVRFRMLLSCERKYATTNSIYVNYPFNPHILAGRGPLLSPVEQGEKMRQFNR